jgi:GH15 family glucan-1,4-alpha-glucosidase
MPRQQYYGVIGNGETCALISSAGNIEWLCLPQFDGQLVFSKMISSLGESIDVDIDENGQELAASETRQEYLDNTAVLKTFLKFPLLEAEFVDFMPWPEPEAMDSDKRGKAHNIPDTPPHQHVR